MFSGGLAIKRMSFCLNIGIVPKLRQNDLSFLVQLQDFSGQNIAVMPCRINAGAWRCGFTQA